MKGLGELVFLVAKNAPDAIGVGIAVVGQNGSSRRRAGAGEKSAGPVADRIVAGRSSHRD